MSASLDDIWDEPLGKEPSSLPNATPAADEADDSGDDMFRPSKRRRSALFLDDPDDIEELAKEKETPAEAPSTSRPDIGALFDEVEEEDGGSSSKPFDIEAYRREAQRRAEKEVDMPSSSYPQHAIRSSSPPAEGDKEKDDGDDEDGERKKKRNVPKIDKARLRGDNGFPALIRQVKSFKPKGKGREQADLNKLMTLYQFWSHKMMPKWTFADTVNRVEKVCRSKAMAISLSEMKDKYNGTIHGKKYGGSDDDSEKGSEDERDETNTGEGAGQASASSPRSRASSSAPSEAAHPPPRPPSSTSGSLFLEDDNDLFDFQGVSGGASSNKAGSTSTEPITDVDESDMWAELDADPSAFDDPPPQASNSRLSGIKLKPAKVVDEDDEMWGILDDMDMDMDQPPPQKPSAPVPIPVSTQQGESGVQTAVTRETNHVPGSAASAAPQISDDPDWDDMYE